MSAIITRRGLVRAAGAAIGASAAGVAVPALADMGSPIAAETGVTASDLDAGLFDLIGRHAEAVADVRRVEAATDQAFAASFAAMPERPDALRWREGDFPRTGLGAALSDDAGGTDAVRWYGERAERWMRPRPAVTWFGGHVDPARAGDEARRVEILAAWDSHMAARWDVEVRTGYAALCEALDAAAELVCDLNAEIARARPRTLPGLRALGAWFGQRVEADDLHDDFLQLLAGTVAGFGEGST